MQTNLIVVPQRFYTDRHGNPNAYRDHSCSLNINDEGQFTCLIRQVNCQSYVNHTYHVGESKQQSRYIALINNQVYAVEYNWGEFEEYATYWKGMEDVRFIDEQQILVVVPERNEGGMPCQFLAQLEFNEYYFTIRLISKLYPCSMEKHWLPFGDQVIYSLNPLIIKSIDQDDREELEMSTELVNKLTDYSGGTNGVLLNMEYVFLIHKHEGKSEHRWMKMNVYDLSIKLSEPFFFYQHAYYEYACSLSVYENKLYIALSVNGDKVMIQSMHMNILNF